MVLAETSARPPGLGLFLTDVPRAVVEYGQLVGALPLRCKLPVGDGHPVLVLPGLFAGDGTTWTLRRLLSRLGYRVHGWGLGVNIGPTPKAVAGMSALLDDLSTRYDSQVSVIGWSLGGIFARRLARQHPAAIRQVITLGSPYGMQHAGQSHATRTFNLFARMHAERHELPLAIENEPLPVPATSIYSRYDGVVSWRTCIDASSERAENIAVLSSHIGFGHHPATIWAVADRLAQPAGTWTPFRPPAALRPLFPRPE